MAGRFAPSPSGDLHLGNLRTALLAWLAARSTGRAFLIRVEDLDRERSGADHARRQLVDLAALGIDHDGPIVRQSDRSDRYRAALDRLRDADLVYPCFCTRREIAAEIEAAATAPHGSGRDAPMRPHGAYPGTCRELTRLERSRRETDGRPPAWRLRGGDTPIELTDVLAGAVVGIVDDVVVQRNDGVPGYNLAVVVDDAEQGVSQVVRGDDLLSSTPRQVHLQRLLGLPTPEYVHVPLVLGPDGERLAKRHGAVTIADLAELGFSVVDVLRGLAASVGLPGASEASVARDLLTALGGRALLDLPLPATPVMVDDLPGLARSTS